MRAFVIRETGDTSKMEFVEAQLSPLQPGEARVKHTAVGVNFIDVYHRSGLYPLPSLPHGIGMEAVGIVDEVGEGVDEIRPGQRVGYVSGPPGSYAEARNIDADVLIPLADGVDDLTAAASLLKGMTAEYLARRVVPIPEGARVLVHAAAGGVGTMLCAWLKHRGANVIGVVSNERKAARAWASGCERVLVLEKNPDFTEGCRALVPGGVDVVFDGVGHATFEASLDCLKRRGTLVGYGNASGPPAPFDPLMLGRKGSLHYTRPVLFDYTFTRKERLASANALFEVLKSGAVKAHIGQTRPLSEAPDAHRALEARETVGSTVLLP